MNESALTRKILKDLNAAEGVCAVKHHGGAFSTAGEPDIYGSCAGRAFLIEVKVGRNMPTKIQRARMRQWARAGANVGVARSVTDAWRIVHNMEED